MNNVNPAIGEIFLIINVAANIERRVVRDDGIEDREVSVSAYANTAAGPTDTRPPPPPGPRHFGA